MAFITKVYRSPLGDFPIHFSTKRNEFEIRWPSELDDAARQKLAERNMGRSKKLLSWADVEEELNRITDDYLHEEVFLRKIIVIKFQSSETAEDRVYNPSGGVRMGGNEDNLGDCEGFILRWYICEEFQCKRERKCKVIEAHTHGGGKTPKNGGKMNILPQLLFWGGENRVFDYREDLHNFLLEMDVAIGSMVKKMVDYFDSDPKKFIENFEQSKLRLLTNGEEGKK